MMRVLVIEDDKRLANLIRKVLESEHFTVDEAHDGDLGLEIALRGVHDAAIIDWMLPGRDGPAVCRAIRAARLPLAILMLTARSQVEDRVAGLYSGADDYLTKPFSFEELIARLHALSRRMSRNAADPLELRAGRLVLDLHTYTARRGDHPLELTRTEWTLLEYLMRHPGQALSRQQILDYVWSYENEVKTTLVDVYVSYLRNKLTYPGLKDPIETVRGVGYRLKVEDA
ncbi:MAG: two component transcriptional regulator, winged helix family [Chloroflexi bacterium]|nr:two component transcriptional regulator, winged helix family [Chloroflexota bacterium]